MTTFIRYTIPWNNGAMLGWNTGGQLMNGDMNQSSNKPVSQQNDANLFTGIKVLSNKGAASSFFPNARDLSSTRRVRSKGTGFRRHVHKHFVEPQKDYSPEFIEYLRSLTQRDFEHSVEVTGPQQSINSQMQNESSDRANNNHKVIDNSATNSKFKIHKVANSNLINGYQLFTAPPPANSRPITVPRYLHRKENGKNNETDQINKKVILKNAKVSDETGTGIIMQALVKTKVTPDQADLSDSDLEDLKDSTGQVKESESTTYASSVTDSERPVSSTSSSGGSKRVTFAADVVNYERENKPPKKRKLAKRRKQGFPHPSRGIFVPPEQEIVESTGPTGFCKNNPYLNFTEVWTHPAGRSSGESSASRLIRQERFHRIMNDLEHAHIHYNRLNHVEQTDYLLQTIFKRYILVLDLALTEGHLTQVEHLLDTISKSIQVLQQNTFFYLNASKIINDLQQNKSEKLDEEDPNMQLTNYALSRLSSPFPENHTGNMSIETVLIKLCLELVQLVFCQYGSAEFRNALKTIPYTASEAVSLLKELRSSKDIFCYIKWINNSAVQRDYRSILKNVGLLDRHGCKADVSLLTSPFHGKSKSRRQSGHAVITRRPKTPPKPIPEMMQKRPSFINDSA